MIYEKLLTIALKAKTLGMPPTPPNFLVFHRMIGCADSKYDECKAIMKLFSVYIEAFPPLYLPSPMMPHLLARNPLDRGICFSIVLTATAIQMRCFATLGLK